MIDVSETLLYCGIHKPFYTNLDPTNIIDIINPLIYNLYYLYQACALVKGVIFVFLDVYFYQKL